MKQILLETANLYCVKVGEKIEIRLNCGSYSFCIGKKDNLPAAQKLVERLEKYPQNLKYLIPSEYRYLLSK